ncbi:MULTISPECIES: hypothetical protein [Paenibacillus]|uniref:hypothetical protein n=1 Tax=Paenibacillus TaxID=44249 RepID=UPI00096ED493|nr:hypothetical protein [Paenibacillus amylolyticus]OMF39017.1 hypothetical protein BK136_28035 [Paenibacillus amylolyticus]
MEPEKLFLAVQLMVGGGLLFLNRSIYQMYGHDLLNRPFMQIVFILMFVAAMHMFRELSLFRLALKMLKDFYRLYMGSRSKD